MIPTLQTDRLTLRASRESDLDAIATFYASDRSRWVGGPKPRLECWRTLTSYLGHWHFRGYGFWQIEETATGETVGAAGFLNPPAWDEPELGWHLYNGFEGKGYATEAATAARTYGAKHFGLDGVISYIAPMNEKSIAMAERLGATYEREAYPMGAYCHIYRHPKIGEAA